MILRFETLDELVEPESFRGACRDHPTVVTIPSDWPRRRFHELASICDEARLVVAEPSVSNRMINGGFRGHVAEPGRSRDIYNELAAAAGGDALPSIDGGMLRSSGDRRRIASVNEPIWTETEARARIEADKKTIIPGWVDYLDAHGERFVHTFTRLPSAGRGARALDTAIFPATCRALSDLGYFTVAAHYADAGVTELYETHEQIWRDAGIDIELRYDAELHRLPVEDEFFDLVLAAEIIEHMPSDPAQFLVELNRVMRWGGRLIVTTPNAISQRALSLAFRGEHPANFPFYDRNGSLDRHHLEYSPSLLRSLVEAAGFEVRTLETLDVWWERDQSVIDMLQAAGHSVEDRGDNIYLVAEKTRSFVDRTPPEIYTGGLSDHVFSHRNQPRIKRTQQRVEPNA